MAGNDSVPGPAPEARAAEAPLRTTDVLWAPAAELLALAGGIGHAD